MDFIIKSPAKFIIALLLMFLVLTGCGIPFVSKKITGPDCRIFNPVCGDDGITYYNICQAQEKKVESLYDGACNNSAITVIPYNPDNGVSGK